MDAALGIRVVAGPLALGLGAELIKGICVRVVVGADIRGVVRARDAVGGAGGSGAGRAREREGASVLEGAADGEDDAEGHGGGEDRGHGGDDGLDGVVFAGGLMMNQKSMLTMLTSQMAYQSV